MELTPDLLKTLLVAADRVAIEGVLGTYCRAIDRLDVELLRSVYHPDAIDDHGAFRMNAHEFADHIITTLAQVCVYSMHTVTHMVIDVQGDVATSEAYYTGVHTVAGGDESIGHFFGPKYLAAQKAAGLAGIPHEYLCGGRYLDVLTRRDGVWRIARREITNEFAMCRPTSVVTEGLPLAFTKPGSRDRSDPVYQLAEHARQLSA